MSYMPYKVDYSGRQVDVEMLQSVSKPADLVAVSLTSVQKTAKIVTGIEKLVQRYALLFLSSIGTVHFVQEQGTYILSNLLAGGIQSRGVLQGLFAVNNVNVLDQLRKDDDRPDIYGDTQPDEVIASADLLDCNVDAASGIVYMQVQITSQAGDAVTFIVPVTAAR